MEATDRWLQVLLWPSAVGPPTATPPTDRWIVSRLLLGHIHAVQSSLGSADHANGVVALIEGALADSHPVSTSLARWVSDFGRGVEVAHLLTQLQTDRLPSANGSVLLAAVALATEERHDEAVAMLLDARTGAGGLAWAALTVQLSCRLLESGRTQKAADACREVLDAEGNGTQSDQLRRTAARNLRIATDFDDDPATRAILTELADVAHAPDTAALTATAMSAVVREAVDVHLASAAGAGSRSTNLDTDLFGLLGVWLQHELWGDYSGIRMARQHLGEYAVAHSVLPFPAGWWHNHADASDLDLIRRSGDDRLTREVARRWWQAGPLDDLQVVMDSVVRRPWPVPTIQCNLAIIQTAGDLVAPDDVDDLLGRVIDIGSAGTNLGFYSPPDAARAMSGLLVVAGPEGQSAAVDAVQSWVADGVSPFLLRPVVTSVRYDRLPTSRLHQLIEWASTLLVGRGEAEQLGVDALLGVANHLVDHLEPARERLQAAFAADPTLDLAAALLRTGDLQAEDHDAVRGWLLDVARERPSGHGSRWSPHHLLAAVAQDNVEFAVLRDHLRNESLTLQQKADPLVQIAARPAIAARVIDPDLVALFEVQSAEPQAFVRDDVDWTWATAAMTAGAVDAAWSLDWIANRLTGTAQRRWQAARAIGAAARVVPQDVLSVLWLSLVEAADIEVAAEAAHHAPALVGDDPDMRVVDRVRTGLPSLLQRDGSLGPLAAGYGLGELGWLDHDTIARLRSHPSGAVRDIDDQS